MPIYPGPNFTLGYDGRSPDEAVSTHREFQFSTAESLEHGSQVQCSKAGAERECHGSSKCLTCVMGASENDVGIDRIVHCSCAQLKKMLYTTSKSTLHTELVDNIPRVSATALTKQAISIEPWSIHRTPWLHRSFRSIAGEKECALSTDLLKDLTLELTPPPSPPLD